MIIQHFLTSIQVCGYIRFSSFFVLSNEILVKTDFILFYLRHNYNVFLPFFSIIAIRIQGMAAFFCPYNNTSRSSAQKNFIPENKCK